MTSVRTSLGSTAAISFSRCFTSSAVATVFSTRLFSDHQRHRGKPVQPCRAAGLFVTVLGRSDIPDLDDVAVSLRHGDLVEFGGVRDAPGGSNRKLPGAGIQVTARQFQVLLPECVEHVRYGQVVGSQPVRIDQHVNLAFGAADHGDLAHAPRILQFLLDRLIGDQGYVAQRPRSRNRNLQDRGSVGIEFLNHGLLGALGEVWNYEVDLVLDLLGGNITVLGKFERDDDE
jgi:hypothetical protein